MTSSKGPAPWLKGIGAMGDSFTNRYSGRDDNPYNLNWVEQLVTLRNLPFGTAANPYAYDVVPGGGNTDSVDAATRQAPALVPLITAGQVNLVSLEIGSHDFGPIAADKAYAKIYQSTADTYDDIYHGRLKGPTLDAYGDAVLNQLMSAATQVQGAGAKVIVANISDFGDCHYVRLGSTSPPYPPHPDPAKRRLVTKAVNVANKKLRQMTRKQGMPLLDLKGLIGLSVGRAPVVVGGLALDRDPCLYPTRTNYFWLDAQHPGMIISGLFANMVVAAANASFKTGIAPLSDQEILRIAGLPDLAPPKAKDTFFDVSPFTLG